MSEPSSKIIADIKVIHKSAEEKEGKLCRVKSTADGEGEGVLRRNTFFK